MILPQYRQLYFSDARGINTAHAFRILKFSTAKNGLRLNAGDRFSLSKNFQNTPVSGIIEETGVYLWNSGEKMQEARQSLWI